MKTPRLESLMELLPSAGACIVRGNGWRRPTTDYHPAAPPGSSACRRCRRIVLRGEGARWWVRKCETTGTTW